MAQLTRMRAYKLMDLLDVEDDGQLRNDAICELQDIADSTDDGDLRNEIRAYGIPLT